MANTLEKLDNSTLLYMKIEPEQGPWKGDNHVPFLGVI